MLGAPERRLLQDFRAFSGKVLSSLWFLTIAGAVAETLGIAVLVPMLALLGSDANVPALLRPLADWAEPLSLDARLAAVLAMFAALMGLRALLLYWRDVLTGRLDADYTADLQHRVAWNLARVGWNRAASIGLGGVQSLLLTEIPRCVYALHEARAAALGAVMLGFSFVLAAWLSPTMAAIALFIVLTGLFAAGHMLKRSRHHGEAISDHVEQSSSASFRLHAGLKAALAQGSVPNFLRDYREQLEALSRETVTFARDSARLRAIGSVAAVAAAAAILFVGHAMLRLPLPILATLLVLFARMSAPAQSIVQAVTGFAANAPAFAAIEQKLGELRRYVTSPSIEASPLPWNELRLDGVGYRHESSGFEIPEQSLVVRAGEWLGLAGPSGSGKTTLADLAVGLLQPDRGALLIDGVPADEPLLERVRPTIAYVGQSEMPFEGSVRRNLLAGTSVSAGDEALWQALATVGLDDRVRQFSAGLDAPLGDRGSALSGGERQRLAIARALLRTPRLIVLDEATNALDPQSEQAILGRLRDMDPRPAILLVAHRQQPLELCDRVIRIQEKAG